MQNDQYIHKKIKFTIKAAHKYKMENVDQDGLYRDVRHEGESWINKIWSNSEYDIKTKFFMKGWEIRFWETNDGSIYNRREDSFIIKRVE